jgi:hypothetical protein
MALTELAGLPYLCVHRMPRRISRLRWEVAAGCCPDLRKTCVSVCSLGMKCLWGTRMLNSKRANNHPPFARVARLARNGEAPSARTASRDGESVSKCAPLLTFIALPAAILVAALLFAPSARGQSLDEMAGDLLHSDLPIFGRGSDNEWPQHFSDDDSFGCTSRVAFGDWVFRQRAAEAEDEVLWYRFNNYGVFHCWANISRAHERAKLLGADSHPSFFAFLGSMSVNGSNTELWTVQIGARPGSEYLLLSRVSADGPIESFHVLQTACPRSNVRDAGSLDILLTRYCAINSRGELIRLARRMVQRPPLGTITHVPADDEMKDVARE